MAKPEPKRISQLDAASPLTGAEQFPLVQNTKTVKASLDTIKNYTDTSCQCTLVSRYNEVGIAASSQAQYLHTYTLPANTLSTDGSWLEIYASGKFAATANFKSSSIFLRQNNSTVLGGIGFQSNIYNDYYWEIELRVQRSSPDTLTSFRKITTTAYNAANQVGNVPDMYMDYYNSSSYSNLWLNDLQLSVVGDSSAASANDITCGQFIVVLHKVDPNS